jgi:cobalt transporter subunit CbtA
MFKRIVTAGALAGILSGLFLTALQQIEIAPLIRAAEAREDAAAVTAQTHAAHSAHDPTGSPASAAWEPLTSRERIFATGAANMALATGFALLLGAAMSLRGDAGWRHGFIYGLAGYAVFFVAPSLGLPPELPGSEAAPLRQRELWWIATVVASASGLGLIAFGRKPALQFLGVALLVAPHAIGAPQPPGHASIHPAAVTDAFIRATYLANAALWIALGALAGFFLRARR